MGLRWACPHKTCWLPASRHFLENWTLCQAWSGRSSVSAMDRKSEEPALRPRRVSKKLLFQHIGDSLSDTATNTKHHRGTTPRWVSSRWFLFGNYGFQSLFFTEGVGNLSSTTFPTLFDDDGETIEPYTRDGLYRWLPRLLEYLKVCLL